LKFKSDKTHIVFKIFGDLILKHQINNEQLNSLLNKQKRYCGIVYCVTTHGIQF